MKSVPQVLVLTIPVIIAGGLHMAVVTLDVLPMLKIPIQRAWFGANKTWRGVIVMPLAGILGVKVTSALWPDAFGGWGALSLGTLLGLGYVIPELPNSFIKRRMHIEPGKRPARHAALFVLGDQLDSTIGCALVYWATLRLSFANVLLLVLIGPALHLIVNYGLFLLKLRKERF
jgi:hypothetical protein